VNNIEIPRSIFLSVEYTEGLDQAASRDSYKGVTLKVEYGPGRTDTRNYFTGDFAADYTAAVEWSQGFGQADRVIPFLASSTLDSFMYEAGYVDAADEEIPFASDADLARGAYEGAPLGGPHIRPSREPDWAEKGMAVFDYHAALKDDLPFLPTTEAEKTVAVYESIRRAWGRVPAEKLMWAIANVITSSSYNTSYPGAPLGRDRAMQALTVLDELLVDEAMKASMRP